MDCIARGWKKNASNDSVVGSNVDETAKRENDNIGNSVRHNSIATTNGRPFLGDFVPIVPARLGVREVQSTASTEEGRARLLTPRVSKP
jgi:hypothetical protein